MQNGLFYKELEIPVLDQFDHNKVIGTLKIFDEGSLPELPDYHIALGYKWTKSSKYKLICASIVPDYKFKVFDSGICSQPTK